MYSAINSAVDPVAVLAVFNEIHVNMTLFILVFGFVMPTTVIIISSILTYFDAIIVQQTLPTNKFKHRLAILKQQKQDFEDFKDVKRMTENDL